MDRKSETLPGVMPRGGFTDRRSSSDKSESFSSHAGDARESNWGPSRVFPWLQKLEKGASPPMFHEFGQPARDLLGKGFQLGHSVSFMGITPVGALLTTSATKIDDIFLGMLSALVIPSPKAQLELSTGTMGVVQGKVTYNDKGPGLAAMFQSSFPLMPASSRASLAYRHQHFTAMASSGLHPNPPVDVSVTVGGLRGDLALGLEGTFDTESNNVTKMHAGIGVNQGSFSAAAFYNVQKRQAVEFLLSQTIDDTLVVGTQYTRKLDATDEEKSSVMKVGLSYKPAAATSVKITLDNEGMAMGLIQHEFRPNSTVGLTAQFDTFTKVGKGEPKIGINVNIMQ